MNTVEINKFMRNAPKETYEVTIELPTQAVLQIDANHPVHVIQEALAAAQDGDWSMFNGGLRLNIDQDSLTIVNLTEEDREKEAEYARNREEQKKHEYLESHNFTAFRPCVIS